MEAEAGIADRRISQVSDVLGGALVLWDIFEGNTQYILTTAFLLSRAIVDQRRVKINVRLS